MSVVSWNIFSLVLILKYLNLETRLLQVFKEKMIRNCQNGDPWLFDPKMNLKNGRNLLICSIGIVISINI